MDSNEKLVKEYDTREEITWCPGCGNFGIFSAEKKAYQELGLKPYQILYVAGIGCSCNGANWMGTNVFHGIHGRTLPLAEGTKLANPELTVVASAGDGDAYGEGLNHFITACRNNIDITYLVHDNRLYSLTTGQASPTSDKEMKTKSTPRGQIEIPLNPIALALDSGATFVARGTSWELDHLKGLIKGAIEHKGFAIIDILQICVTLNLQNTLAYYKDKIYKLEEDKSYNFDDLKMAREKAYATEASFGDRDSSEVDDHSSEVSREQGGGGAGGKRDHIKSRIPIGLFYKDGRLTYEKEMEKHKLPSHSLTKSSLHDIDISELLQQF